MYTKELLEESRREAIAAKAKFKKLGTIPSGASGGDGAAAAGATRASMRKNMDNIAKDAIIRPVLKYLEKEGPYIRGIIPHPVAWDVMEADGTYYLHTIDGTEVECVYSRKNERITFHRLIAGDKIFIDSDTDIELEKNNFTRLFAGLVKR